MDLVTMLVLGVMGVVVIAALVLFLGALATRFYRKVDQGQALIINKTATTTPWSPSPAASCCPSFTAPR
jgi:uncharacterized membrane protein YqiK